MTSKPTPAAAASPADEGRPYRCGAFNTANGEQCVLESDHAWAHIMPSEVVEHPEKPAAVPPAHLNVDGMVVTPGIISGLMKRNAELEAEKERAAASPGPGAVDWVALRARLMDTYLGHQPNAPRHKVDEYIELFREALAAAPRADATAGGVTERLARLEAGMNALQRTIDVHESLTIYDYIGGVGVDDAKQRIVVKAGDDILHDVGSIEELLIAEAASWRETDAAIAIMRSDKTDTEKAEATAALRAAQPEKRFVSGKQVMRHYGAAPVCEICGAMTESKGPGVRRCDKHTVIGGPYAAQPETSGGEG